jgi:aquaporin Z
VRATLRGETGAPSAPQPKVGGWHWAEWLCELGGTLVQLFLGFGAVALLESPLAPGKRAIPSDTGRLLLVGLAFGLLAAAVATSPPGRRSGAHLNPAVTAGFWARGHTHAHDLVGYVAAQCLGALAAAGLFRLAFGSWATSVGNARTAPRPGLSLWAALGIECALTFGLLVVVFAMVSHHRTARFTPAAVVLWLPVLICLGAPQTGASVNPARTLGPDLVSALFPAVGVYLVAPVAGALLAAAAFTLSRRTTLTPKLFHDPAYTSTQRSLLPAKPAPPSRSHP